MLVNNNNDKYKNKEIMAKNYFLNQAESFTSES